MIDFNSIAKINIARGNRSMNDNKNSLCIMEMVSYFNGDSHITDRPACTCPILTEYAIYLNDIATNQTDRNSLKALLPLLTGTVSDDHEIVRAIHLIEQSYARIIIPTIKLYQKRNLENKQPSNSLKYVEAVLDAAYKAKTIYEIGNAVQDDIDFNKYINEVTDSCAFTNNRISNIFDYVNSACKFVLAPRVPNIYYGFLYKEAIIKLTIALKFCFFYLEDTAPDFARWMWYVRRQILIEAINLGPHGGLDVEVYNLKSKDLQQTISEHA